MIEIPDLDELNQTPNIYAFSHNGHKDLQTQLDTDANSALTSNPSVMVNANSVDVNSLGFTAPLNGSSSVLAPGHYGDATGLQIFASQEGSEQIPLDSPNTTNEPLYEVNYAFLMQQKLLDPNPQPSNVTDHVPSTPGAADVSYEFDENEVTAYAPQDTRLRSPQETAISEFSYIRTSTPSNDPSSLIPKQEISILQADSTEDEELAHIKQQFEEHNLNGHTPNVAHADSQIPVGYSINADFTKPNGQYPITNLSAAENIVPQAPSQNFSLDQEPQELAKSDLEEENNNDYVALLTTNSSSKVFTFPNRAKESPILQPPPSAMTLQTITLTNDDERDIRRSLASALKKPVEYTMHIVFTQFVKMADVKLDYCMNYPQNDDPPVMEVLGEGVDSKFDKVISALGYISRRKPRPIVEVMMQWRSRMTEDALLPSGMGAKGDEVSKRTSMAYSSLDNSNAGLQSQNIKKRRSMSIIRSKSHGKFNNGRRDTSINSSTQRSNASLSNNEIATMELQAVKIQALKAERRSLSSVFLLCRVLIEIIKQTSIEDMGINLSDKLEEMVYKQLKLSDPILTSQSLVRSANWNLCTELLGNMSEQRFLSVSDRFVADLEKVPTQVKHEDEPLYHLLIQGMKYLKLKNDSLERFEESSEFILSLAKFFERSRNEAIVFAYCDVLGNLLLPLANILTAETNHPTWVEAMERIYNKAYKIWYGHRLNHKDATHSTSSSSNSNTMTNSSMINNVFSFSSYNGWTYSMHLMTAVLVVSRKELFSESWLRMIEDNSSKLKVKVPTDEKTTFIICIARLLWVYVYRLPDTLNNTIKRLDSLFDMLFFNPVVISKKNQWISFDMYLINGLEEIIKVVGYHHLNYVLDNVLIKLLKIGFPGPTLENLSPERVILVIKSYLSILEDCELGNKPLFPTDEELGARVFKYNIAGSRWDKSKNSSNVEEQRNKIRLNEFMFLAKTANNEASHEEICRSFATLFKLLDIECGSEAPKQTTRSHSNSLSKNPSIFNFGIDFSYASKNIYYEVFANLMNAVPWTMVPVPGETKSLAGIPFKQVVEILTRNVNHSDERVANAAVTALKRLLSRKNPTTLVTTFAKIAFQFTERPNPSYDYGYTDSHEFHRLLKLYVELLNCWLQQFNDINESRKYIQTSNPLAQEDEVMNQDVLNDLYQINHKIETSAVDAMKFKPSDDLEWKEIITVIEEIEGNGLFFLCSQDFTTRFQGLSILKLVEKFDQVIYEITDSNESANNLKDDRQLKQHSRSSSKFAADVGTRLANVLQDVDFFELLKPIRRELSNPERQRLSKLRNKKNMLIRLAESDHGLDTTVWFRIFPRLLDIFFERCPMPVAMCRSIVCVRLVQMHEQVLEYSDSNRMTTSFFSKPSSTPPEVLINQWKIYLIFACCSLTSTSEQRIAIPTKPSHGRKKSMQMYIQHQKITSAKSIFRMMIPFLKTELTMVRDAVVTGLSSININIFQTLLENTPSSLNEWGNQPKRDIPEDRLRIGLIQILSNITRKFVSEPFIFGNDWIIEYLVSIVKDLKNFLSLPTIQVSVDFQRLRRFWCSLVENVFKGLQHSLDVDKWFPFEARLGCYTYLHEWCGYGESSRMAEERYALMLRKADQVKDATSAAAILEIERKALKFASLSCMTALCSSPISQLFDIPGTTALMSFDIPALMFWIHSLFCSRDGQVYDIGKVALHNVLVSNINNDGILQHIVRECYVAQESSMNTSLYIVTFLETILEHKEFTEMSLELMCLANLLVGHDDYDVRFAAIKLLVRMEEIFYTTSTSKIYMEGVCSRTRLVYKRALFDVSNSWAAAHPERLFEVISYFTKFFNLVDSTYRKDISSCLLPWIQHVDLKCLSQEEGREEPPKLESTSNMVLYNLIEISVKFSWELPNEVQALWIAIGAKPSNNEIILDFIMEACLVRKSPQFVDYARQINDYLTFSLTDVNATICKYIDNLQTKSMVPRQFRQEEMMSASKIDSDLPYIADILEIIQYNEKDAIFSVGQLSMIFLVDMFTVQRERMVESLPLLLQVSFSLLDHYIPIVQEAACSLLVQLVHTLAPNEPKSEEVTRMLRKKDNHKDIWLYDDLTNDSKGTRTPKSMDQLARSILEIFANSVPTLQDEWSRVSLNWATTCAVRHIACRSFQLFRSLLSFLDQRMLKDMLHRLSNTISDESVDIQGFAIQILMTLNAITAELQAESLIDFPQLFWVSVACLSTIHEQEFIEVLSTMSKFISKIDLDSPDTISCLISAFPMKWEGKFDGLQNIVLTGLRSGTSWNITIKFLDKLNTLKDSDIIGVGDGRLIMSVVSNLPRFLHALEQKTISKDVYDAAVQLSKLADECHKPALARILNSMSKNRFRSKKDFLVQTLATIKSNFFPQYEGQVLVLLLGFLLNTIPWVKLETLALLKQVFPLIDLQRDEFLGVGADLIFPLLRLLYTDYAEQALEVLDEVVAIPGSKLDPSFLRVSIGDNDTKKEYEQTATLFGLPNENGWSIPMPSTTTNRTRSNVHAVFTTCEVTTVNDDENNNKDEEIEFHMEDFYEPHFEYGDNFSVGMEEPDASLSHMWAALDDFDSFFTKETDNLQVTSPRRDPHIHFRNSSMSSNETISPIDSVPQIYDKKVLGMLNKSLARSQSNASFKANLVESVGTVNVSEQNTLVSAKRSYLPFRHNKISKSKVDNFTTPLSQTTATFEQHSSTPIAMTTSPSFEAGGESHQSPARLDFLIGGKKRVKRSSKISPTHSPVNNSAENLQGMLWPSARQSGAPQLQQQLLQAAPLPSLKSRERKRASQKFK